jgi:two-component system, OmpR family, sensor kinase
MRLFKRLHVRLALAALMLLLATTLALLFIVRAQQQQAMLETTQRLNLGLAQYIVEHQPRALIAPDGRVERELLKALAQDVMMINPAVEVYLLDAEGRILGHALEGASVRQTQVDLRAVQPLLAGEQGSAAVRLPVLGDDPREPGQPNIVSVAPIRAGSRLVGHLYVVLQGQASRQLAHRDGASTVWLHTVAGFAVAAALAGVVLWAALVVLTRPLRRLAGQMRAFRSEDGPGEPVARGDEVALVARAAQQMQQRIAQQFERLQETDRTRRELVSNISHDLHTPLASIQGYVEMLLLKGEHAGAQDRRQALEVVLTHCKRLSRRIADLFELSKLDSGRVSPRLEVFNLAELLQDVLHSYRLQAEQRGVTLQLSAGSRQPVAGARVLADIALIERVFQNLIDNALRHTGSGGRIEVAIVPLPAPREDRLRVTITDSGSGIAHEDLPHVFERYYQASRPQQVQPGASAGLGLAIVKRILDLHGATIQVQSPAGGGTRFEFALKAA